MKNLRKLLATMLALLMVMSFVPAFAAILPSADGITLSRTSSYITVGMTVQLTADADVTWSTSNDAVATVSESGLVTAVAVGKADITATTSDGKTAVCKVDVYDIEIRNHVSTPTPDVDGGQFLTDLFDAEKFKVMLTFDDNADDVTGNINTTVKDNLTYENGFNGKAANFKNGYVELTDAVLGKDSITISTWIKAGELAAAPPDYIFSTTPHNPTVNINDGMYIGLKTTAVELFYIRKPAEDTTSGTRQNAAVTVGTDTPADIYDGWVNLTWVINKTNNRLLVYVDYELVKNIGISSIMQYDGEFAPMLGRGIYTGGTTVKYDGLMDDFFIYDGAMTESDLQKIKAYYKLVGAVPTEGMELNKDTLSLDINETSSITATITPANATTSGIVWTTSDANVATVKNGKVRAIGAGNATITATTVDGGFVDSCLVTVSNNTEPFIYDRVCIIGVDGGGAWLDDNFMPNVQRIFENGATTNNCKTALPSVSAPGWGSIIHGVTPSYHKLTNYIAGGTPYPEDSPYPSFFRVLHEAEPDAVMATIVGYHSINTGIVENNIGVQKINGTPDSDIRARALKYLAENDPKLMFIHFEEGDSKGHQGGYGAGNPTYVQALSNIDGYIGEIYDVYEEKGLLDSTLFILTADHGGTPGGSHGADSDAEMNVFLGLRGPGVKVKSDIVDAELQDVAAIVTHALGLEKPETWTAKVPDGAFDGVFGDTRNVVEIPVSDYRDHVNTKAPKVGKGHLTDLFGAENFEFLYEFEDEAKDLSGNHTTKVNNTITYEDGYFGKSANFSRGSITLDNCDIGNKDVTIGAWVKTKGFDNRALLMSSKALSTEGDGFYITMDKSYMTLAIRNDATRNSFSDNYYPTDMKDGWMHVLIVLDKTNGRVKLYYDFEIANGQSLSKTELPIANLPITIGSTLAANHPFPLTAALDDIFIYNGAMTDEEIAQLQTYYAREGALLHVNDIEFGDSAVSFDFVVDGDATGSSIYAAIYDENMKLINVKKIPARIAGGESVPGGENAKFFKAFLIGDDLVPKCISTEATKPIN